MGDTPITLYAVFKYPNVTVTSANGTYNIQSDNYDTRTDVTRTLYTLDTSKYSSHIVTASVPRLSAQNTTTGYLYNYAYVDGTLVRFTQSSGTNVAATDAGTYLGTNGASFKLTRSGNLTIRAVLQGYAFSSSYGAHFKIESLILNGKTVVG